MMGVPERLSLEQEKKIDLKIGLCYEGCDNLHEVG
jgi:hypothetical protein